MVSIKSTGSFVSAGVISAIAASLCCITPIVGLLAGSSSIASNFLWIEPARPYLIALSMVALAFAWYVKLKPAKTKDIDCNCETRKKVSFFQSKTLLGLVTVFAIVMMTFPLYAKMLTPKPKTQVTILAAVDNKQQVKFTILGMTCSGCELEVNNELSKVNGVIAWKTSYATGNSWVTFDKTKIYAKAIEAVINKTGYKVRSYEVINGNCRSSKSRRKSEK